MIKNYIKIAWRNLLKDKQFTFLNVLGLSAGITCTLLIYLWVHDELSYDRFFDNESQIYQVMEHRKTSGSQQLTDESSGLVSDLLKVAGYRSEICCCCCPAGLVSKINAFRGR